ncbi:hypothetical protein SAMN05444173_1615 [Opitutus sp. GAS368]|jgi:hypothetical protein|nr:hypothetical protein SAMN05444173_1615 [Opitutus sp. GAS368]
MPRSSAVIDRRYRVAAQTENRTLPGMSPFVLAAFAAAVR